MIKYLSAAVIAASFVLAGCSSMSDTGDRIKSGAEKFGVGGSKTEEPVTDTTAPDTMTPDNGAVVDQNTGTAVEEPQNTTTETQSGSESMWDKAKHKAQDLVK
ncbi:MAG: hypothetical protein Q4A16_01445 [Lautropia sp.]|nr:hypothetical protein [Lautropia sp.]